MFRPGGIVNYYERHIGDYLKNTAHLSLLEHGIYTRLLDVYYTREDGIPVDQVERLIGVRSKEERNALGDVLDEFFTVEKDVLHQARCDREIARYRKKAAHNREVGKLGGRPRKTETQTEPTNNPVGFKTEPTNNPPQYPVTSNHTNTPKPPAAAPDGFAQFWSAYPKKVGKPAAEKAFRAAKLNGHLPEVLADVEAKAASPGWTKDGGQFVPNPATYLNQRRWEDRIDAYSPPIRGPDPELMRLEADRKKAVPPSLEILERMAKIRQGN